ncbi:MAG: hypothetical protein V8S72_01075 [Oscillospiraceae bacterium]
MNFCAAWRNLCERAERSGTVCSSGYLSPTKRYQTEEWAKRRGCTVVFPAAEPTSSGRRRSSCRNI